MNNLFKLSKEKRDKMVFSIKYYFKKEREEEIGDLQAGMLLDFFLNEIAAEIYNQGIEDAHSYLNEKIEDMLGLQK